MTDQNVLFQLFGRKLNKGAKLFRASKVKLDLNRDTPAWYTDNLDEVSKLKYGDRIYSFKTTKDLKLINLSSFHFNFHCMDQINIFFKGDENHNDDVMKNKLMAMLAMGFPNFPHQKDTVNMYFDEINPPLGPYRFNEHNQPGINKRLQKSAEMFNGHRYSDANLDKKFVELLVHLYGTTFDGYIIPVEMPSCWHRFFPPEVCLFHPKDALKYMNSTRPDVSSQPTKGGRKWATNVDPDDNPMDGRKILYEKMCNQTFDDIDTSWMVEMKFRHAHHDRVKSMTNAELKRKKLSREYNGGN
jgi:hypothetical protein